MPHVMPLCVYVYVCMFMYICMNQVVKVPLRDICIDVKGAKSCKGVLRCPEGVIEALQQVWKGVSSGRKVFG